MAYTLYYFLNGGTNHIGNPATFEAVDLPITLLDPSKDGHTFAGWYDNGDFIGNPVTQITAEGDDAIYAKWTVDSFAVEFVDIDSTVLQTADYEYGADLSEVTPPEDPTLEGYTFAGWDSTVPATMPSHDVTITATYDVNQYTISFESNGGSAVEDIVDDYGVVVVAPADPTLKHYTFDDWYEDELLTTPYVFTTMPAEDITLYAGWTLNQYTISFEENGGSAVADITQDYGSDVTEPAEPTKANLNFGGWYSDALLTTPYVFTTMPDEDITLYARWYAVVEFDSNGGSAVDDQDINSGDMAVEPTATTREGYTFGSWYTDDGTFLLEYDFEATPVSGDITLYAKWTINSYALEFQDYDDTVLQTADYEFGADLSEATPPADPARTGYTFDDWDTVIPATMPAADVIIHAVYTIDQHTITFDVNGGSAIGPITQDYGTDIEQPADPTKTGYTFGGWFSDAGLTTPYVFETMLASDFTIYAAWEADIYAITYVSLNGAVHTNPATFTVEDLDITLTDPVARDGYLFGGWATKSLGIYVPITEITELANITIYAQWKAIGDYIALPIYSVDDYSYRVNKNMITEINPVVIDKTLYRVKVIITPGTLVLLAGLYETYDEALAASEDLNNTIASLPFVVDGGEL